MTKEGSGDTDQPVGDEAQMFPPETPDLHLEDNFRVADLREWWRGVSEADFEAGVPKIGEYTAADLQIMGTVMETWGLSAPKEGIEAAIMFYILGKVARAVAAYREGRQPSIDTLHDITYYSMMARRVRETGEWP
jgi:hypothetical protein